MEAVAVKPAAAQVSAQAVGGVVDGSLYTKSVISPTHALAKRTDRDSYDVVDMETGEVVTVKFSQFSRKSIGELAMAPRHGFDEWDVPTEAEVARAVQEVCNTYLYTKSVIPSETPAEDAPARRGPKPKVAPNPFCDYFTDVEYEDMNAPGSSGDAILPSVIEDIMTIASRTTDSNTIVPVKQILRCMRLPVISTSAVLNCLNSTREPSQWIGEHYARTVAKTLRNVISRMQALADADTLPNRPEAFDAEADAAGYAEYVAAGKPPFTELSGGHIYTEAERNSIRAQYGITRWN